MTEIQPAGLKAATTGTPGSSASPDPSDTARASDPVTCTVHINTQGVPMLSNKKLITGKRTQTHVQPAQLITFLFLTFLGMFQPHTTIFMLSNTLCVTVPNL